MNDQKRYGRDSSGWSLPQRLDRLDSSEDAAAEVKACQAGAAPNSRAVTTATAAVNSSTCRSGCTSITMRCGSLRKSRPDSMMRTPSARGVRWRTDRAARRIPRPPAPTQW